MSGKIAKSQVPTIQRSALPADVQMGIVQFKNRIRNGLRASDNFDNRKDAKGQTGPPLPKPALGCCYVEGDVGQGRVDRGKRRLVAEIVEASGQIRELYFTDEHYAKGSFLRIL